MEIETLIANIAKNLSIITFYIRFENSANLNSINTLLENPFKDIMNIIFDYNLINLNTAYLYPAVDLGDESKKVAVQVTSTNDISKIKHTLTTFNKNNLQEKYDKLKILIIEEKHKYRNKVPLDTSYFVLNDDVIFVYDLVKYIKDLDLEKIRKINNILIEVIGTNHMDDSIDTESNEVKTIMNIIQILSNNSDEEELSDENTPNPNYKINERFAEYKEYLIQIFKDLYPIYFPVFDKVEKQLNLGTIRVRKISTYLKNESRRKLIESQGNLYVAYDSLVNMIEEKLKNSVKINYDKNAIEFYIIMNIIKCNVFPND